MGSRFGSGRLRSDGTAFFTSILGDVSDFDLHLALELGGTLGEDGDTCAAVGTRQAPTSAVSFDGNNDATGLQLTQLLPGPKSWTIAGFFYFASNPTISDAPLFMLQDTFAATPTNYQNLEIDNAGALGFSSPASSNTLASLSTGTWYFACCSIDDKGATIYWGAVGSGLSSSAVTVTNAFTPLCLTLGTDNFFSNGGGDTPFVGRLSGWKVWSRALSSAEATAESLQIDPASADRLRAAWSLTDTAAKGLNGASNLGTDLVARGAGTWSSQNGPFFSSTVTGTIALTEAGDTAASSGSSVTGTAPLAEAADTIAAAGSSTTGTIAITEAGDVVASSGTDVDFIGTITVTEAGDTSAAAGSSTTGSIALSEANDTASSSGSVVDFTGSIALTEAGDTLAATGSFTASGVTGSIALTEADDTAAATGSVAADGSAALTEAGDVVASSGTDVDFIGTALLTEASDTVASSGSNVVGSIGLTEASDVLAAAGSTVKGTVAITEAGDVAASSGTDVDFIGTIAVVEAPDVLQAADHVPITGTIAIVEAGDVLAFVGHVIIAITAYAPAAYDFTGYASADIDLVGYSAAVVQLTGYAGGVFNLKGYAQ